MFRNKLFLKIVMIFTLPVLGILYFSSILVLEKIEMANEVELNHNNLHYIKAVEEFVSSLEKEQNLSLKYLSSRGLNKELIEHHQEVSKKALLSLEKYKEEKAELKKYKLEISDLISLRKQIYNLNTTPEEIIKCFNQTTKTAIDSMFLIKFAKLSNDFRVDLSKMNHFLNVNQNIDGISKIFADMLGQLEREVAIFDRDVIIERNLSFVYLFFCFFTLISLFFVLKNIIYNEQKSFDKIQKHKHIYEILNATNKFLMKTFDKERLYSNVCELLSENEHLKFCFIYDFSSKMIVAKDGELKDVVISQVDKYGNVSHDNLVSKTMKYETNIIINNFKEKNISVFYKDADKLNIRSMATFPIKKFNQVIGVLIIYSKELEFFDQEVEILFDKLVSDITHCLEKIEYENIRLKQESELRLSSYAFDSSAPMIITDVYNNIIKVNQAFCKIMGYSKEEIIGQNPRIFKTAHQDKEFVENLWNSLKINGNWSGDVYNKKANDEIIALKATITVIKNQDEKITNYLGQYMDNSEQKDKEKILEYQATHDNLTGLPNRLLLTDRIEHAITKTVRHKIFGGLIFIDLDNFKAVNDTLGHDIGDVLLITVAKKIKQVIRDEDTVSRIGGDEFIVLIDNIGNNSIDAKKNITSLAEKIKETLNDITHIEGHVNISTPSIGITLFSDASVSVKDIIKQADTAMYSAKKQGKNAIEFF
ncbi:sensor domain-containing diguanylate cyclase [Aliarcobacter butzleri]|uniref:sensor domain-containing diguanylate cyclase n=1 Tax=Aliarcobacter butzleri TaxID=28197 RepID=UPI00263CA856|nr:diguanylate cyclase [Aliarcobacter butzleri]MDN5082732.1 diguanylate cyclase [Aliarcobacter butzleri]MDN5084654.1 diguanylate cyclase [Aliarcobacter butzleri]